MNTRQRCLTITSVQEQLAIEKLYEKLFMLQEEYPEFKNWFFDKVVPETLLNNRRIFVASCGEEIAGVAIVKNSDEKKICTLRVMPEFRHMGIGQKLICVAIEYLQTRYPLITVSDDHVSEFKHLFDKLGFIFTEVHLDYYREGHMEYVFNGNLR